MANLGFSEDWTAGNPFLGAQNPYLQANIDAALGDQVRNYNLAVKPNTESSMVRSGSFGNSGVQQMQQNQQRDLAQTMGNTAAGMRMQDYGQQQQMYQWDQGFNRNLYNDAFAQNNQNLQNFMGIMSTGNQFNNQDLTNANTIQNAPMNYFTQFSGAANGIGGNGGTSTQNQTASGSPVMGALGGWQLGSAISKNLGFGQ